MKRSLVSLAAMVAAGSVTRQNRVTLFGTADATAMRLELRPMRIGALLNDPDPDGLAEIQAAVLELVRAKQQRHWPYREDFDFGEVRHHQIWSSALASKHATHLVIPDDVEVGMRGHEDCMASHFADRSSGDGPARIYPPIWKFPA